MSDRCSICHAGMMYMICFFFGSLVTWAILAAHEDHAAMHHEPGLAYSLALHDIAGEVGRARAKFPPMRSAHEGANDGRGMR